MPEDFEEITDAIYRAMNSTKLLGICIMRLSGLKETTLHGLRWNNSLFTGKSSCTFVVFFAEVWYLYTQC